MACKPIDPEAKKKLQDILWNDSETRSATPDHVLKTQVMDPRIPKNEREHWAARTIATLEQTNQDLTEQNRLLEQQLSTLREKYNELLYGVENKFPEETRHETALRYILERERQPSQAAAQALADTGESDNQGPEGVMSPSP